MEEGFLPLKLTALVLRATLCNAGKAWLMSFLEYSSHRNYTTKSTKQNKKPNVLSREQSGRTGFSFCAATFHENVYNVSA